MKSFIKTIQYGYLQRTRTYPFLITLCFSLAFAYTLIPAPEANYSTVRVASFTGNYNSAWIGSVSAIMTSTFLSLIGLYLVNNSIKTDVDTKVGQIIASTSISNFNYLFSKVLSNFLVLFTIAFLIFCMSIALFFLYGDGYTFELIHFVTPYLLITLPALFIVAVIAVIFEVFLESYSVIQNIGFFFVFMLLLGSSKLSNNASEFDIISGKVIALQMEKQVNELGSTKGDRKFNIGFTNVITTNKFDFNPVPFSTNFILSRLIWVLLGIASIGVIAPLFHRFNIKKRKRKSVKSKGVIIQEHTNNELTVNELITIASNFSIIPLLKTELLLIYRNGKKGLWVLNLGMMILLLFIPRAPAHQLILPLLWFLQVTRLSNLSSKEVSNNVHYFIFSSYKPMSRLLFSKLISGVLLMLVLAIPLIIRFTVVGDFTALISIILGGVFIVVLAMTLGILTNSKKLFEVLFFMLTYANISGVPILDYFGGFPHQPFYVVKLLVISISLGFIGVISRKIMMRKI